MGGGGILRRGQVAVEYMATIGIVMLILAPLFIVYYTQTNELSMRTTEVTLERAAQTIVQAADTVYFIGAPATRSVTITIPENVRGVRLENTAIVFNVTRDSGPADHPAWSVTNLTGGFEALPGPHHLTITALPDGRVNITER